MAAPLRTNGSTIEAPLPPTVRRQYSFTDFSQNNPTTPPLGNRMDAEYDRVIVAVNTLIAFCSAVKQLAPAVTLTPNIAGADPTALEQDYAAVTQAWAEYMPDTIPPNILAVMNVTGDHWSSRWWANYAAQLFQNQGPFIHSRYIYVATAGQTVFQGPDRDGHTLAEDPANNQVQVFKQGLLLTPPGDYTQGHNQVTLTAPASAGSIVQVFVTVVPQPVAPLILQITGSTSFTPQTGGNYTLFVANGTAANVTVTLGAGVTSGQTVTIKDTTGNAGTYPITIQAAATIDNNASYALVSDFASLTLVWTGVLWGTL